MPLSLTFIFSLTLLTSHSGLVDQSQHFVDVVSIPDYYFHDQTLQDDHSRRKFLLNLFYFILSRAYTRIAARMSKGRHIWQETHPLEFICRWYEDPSNERPDERKLKIVPMKSLQDILTSHGIPLDSDERVTLTISHAGLLFSLRFTKSSLSSTTFTNLKTWQTLWRANTCAECHTTLLDRFDFIGCIGGYDH